MFLNTTRSSNHFSRIAGKNPFRAVVYTAPLLAMVYLCCFNHTFISAILLPLILAIIGSEFNKHFSSQPFTTPILVSGDIFNVMIIDGYSEVKSKSYIHLYNPGIGGITYAPANAS